MIRFIISSGILLGLLCTVAPAEEQNKATSSQPESLTVTVKSISGSAEVREGADKDWRAVKAGDTYQEGAEIRTGFKAMVELVFADNSQMILKRSSHFRVDKFRRSGSKVVTRSHLSYGKIKAGVEKGPAFSDYKITTSLGTLGVNGTEGINLELDPAAKYANVCLFESGNIGWDTGSGTERNVFPGACTDQDGTGLDRTASRSNNLGLVDPFGSTGTEQGVGDSNSNQGSNDHVGTTNHGSTTGTGRPWHN